MDERFYCPARQKTADKIAKEGAEAAEPESDRAPAPFCFVVLWHYAPFEKEK